MQDGAFGGCWVCDFATGDWAESSQVRVTLRSLSALGEERGQLRSRKVCREKLRERGRSINRTLSLRVMFQQVGPDKDLHELVIDGVKLID